LLGKFTTSP